MRIMKDPGHGGSDPGAMANGLVEKDLNLQLAQLAAKALAKLSEGYVDKQGQSVEIRLTRDKDETLSQSERLRRIAAFNPDICVSVHFNSATNAQATGTEVFHAAKDSRDDQLADLLIKHLAKTGMPSRGTKTRSTSAGEDYYYIIREVMDHDTISVLLEGAFLTNSDDAKRIKDGWISQAAEAVAQAVFDCIKPQLKKGKPVVAKQPIMIEAIPTLTHFEDKSYESYIIKGVTHTPVRGISESNGLLVGYDADSKETTLKRRR